MKHIKYIVLALLLVGSTACNEKLETARKIPSADSLPRLSMQGAEILYSDSSRVKMKLVAQDIIYHTEVEEPFTEFEQKVRVEFYDKALEVDASLDADYARYDEKTDLWEYRGNVRLQNRQGDVLTTEQLYANREEEKIYSTKAVNITSPDGTSIQGDGGFESNLQFTEYEFKDVSGKINTEGQDETQ